MSRRTPALLALTLVLLALAGCSGAELRAYAIRPEEPPPTQPGDRIVVQGVDGNIFTINPDGSGRVNLTDDATATRQYRQPTWSPDATRVAAARVDSRGDALAGALVTISHDGILRSELPLSFPPFYIHWSPSGATIAYLSNWRGLEGPSMALRLVDVAANTASTIAEGAPYYFAWAPDSSQIVAHLSNLRVELQDVDGARTALATTAALFGAPQWSADGLQVVYAVESGGRQAIVLADTQGIAVKEISDFDGRASFALSPDGSQIAYVLTPAAATVNSLGPLFISDIETLATRQLTDAPVWAFFWSPDSRKLAYLATDSRSERLWLRWYVWDGVENRAYSRYLPSRTFLENYLAFSDQYARSMNLWSPQSDAFAFAGIVGREDGRRGVWVQRLDEELPEWVASGNFAAWSPR